MMRTVKPISRPLTLVCLLFTAISLNLPAEEGARRLKFLNYPDCIELSNKAGTVVILGHHVGGRVLSYRQDGKESLYLNPSEAKWTPKNGKKSSSAGRFDIGPEYLIPKRAALWSGQWTAKITGKGYGLAISNGRLLVSTDRGYIHCFQ